jgi:6-phosphofructokinase 1
MDLTAQNFQVATLGECRVRSPMSGVKFTHDGDHVLYHSDLHEIQAYLDRGQRPPAFETAGPREKIYFDPSKLKCGIVTCGGLCPGLNDVIRAVVLTLSNVYGVRSVFGFRYGYEGLSPNYGHPPLELTPQVVETIHEDGGTILGSSRGNQDVADMVDTLEQMKVGILFTIGGDGTLRGAGAIAEEVGRRGLKIAVVGIPKTIDNDISFVDFSFGFQTAGSEARVAVYAANSEALGARNGIGLVKLMGRDSGWIAAYASLANAEVDFCLIPEATFTLEAFLAALEVTLKSKGHSVIVVAEGAGQDLLAATEKRDASGNIRYGDIGTFLRDRIKTYFVQRQTEITLKYIDPSYIIRSLPANAWDSAFCLLLGQNAVHAGMAGRTNLLVGNWKNQQTHVPIPLTVSGRKKIDPEGWVWNGVLVSTGQPRVFSGELRWLRASILPARGRGAANLLSSWA